MISTSLRPAWSTRRVSGQLRLQSEITSRNKTNAIEQYWQNWASGRGPGQEGRSGFQPVGQGVRGFFQTLPLGRGEEVPESPSHLHQESGLLGPLKPCPELSTAASAEKPNPKAIQDASLLPRRDPSSPGAPAPPSDATRPALSPPLAGRGGAVAFPLVWSFTRRAWD